jgi:ribosomal protein L7/L12
MDQLIQLVAEKTGLGADKAKEAVDAVLSFINEKLPAPIAGQIDSLLSGEGAGDLLDKGKDMLGGLFGDK